MCAKRTIKEFDQAIMILPMKFMSLGYTGTKIRDTSVHKHIVHQHAPKKKIRISRGLGGRRDKAQTNADVILRFLF